MNNGIGAAVIVRAGEGRRGGFVASDHGGSIAGPEKALFDLGYLRAAAGDRAYVPELTLPDEFDRDALSIWVDRIGSSRLSAA